MNNRRKGFTLIELLLGMLIFSVIALSLYGIFAAGLKINSRWKSTMRLPRQAFEITDYIGRDMENMVFYDLSGSYPQKKSFGIDQNSVWFVRSTGQGLKAVRYGLESPDKVLIHEIKIGEVKKKNERIDLTSQDTQTPDLTVLTREEADLGDFLQNGFDNADRQILARDVAQGGFKIEVSDVLNPGQTQPSWQTEWSKQNLPAALKVELTLRDVNGENPQNFTREIFIPDGG